MGLGTSKQLQQNTKSIQELFEKLQIQEDLLFKLSEEVQALRLELEQWEEYEEDENEEHVVISYPLKNID